MSDQYPYVPGLAGVPAARSSICYLDGSAGKLQYRGYDISFLAKHCRFEEVVLLLFGGDLPTEAELSEFERELQAERVVKAELLALLRTLPPTAHPMNVLASALAATATYYRGDHVEDIAFRRKSALRLVAQIPTLVAAWHRIRSKKDPVAPRSDLGHAANFLYMLSGEAPDELTAHVLDVALILHAEHQMNASTFSARVVGSTLADPYITSAAAVGALSGRLHGGANERVLAMLRTIPSGSSAGVRDWAEDMLARKEKIMGFGHREYKVKDPRATILQGLAGELFDRFGRTPIYDTAVQLETQMEALVGHKGIYPNVDFYSGIVYEKMGIETDLFTPIFTIARIAGWMAHLLEQLDTNRIFRPNQIWIGEHDRQFVPLSERG
ncbi:MAG: citrate synthase [Myxococcota bacterium]